MAMLKSAFRYRKSIVFFLFSIGYTLLFGLLIKPWFLNFISGFGRTERDILVSIAIAPTWILFACSLAYYYEKNNGK